MPTDTPKMLFVRGGVERDSAGKKAGKGALLTDDEAATLDAGNHWTLFQPQAFDEMNFTTDDDTHHVLRAGTKQSTGVVVPQAFRKSRRAQSATDDTTWVADGQANTLNVFNQGDTRTTHAVIAPTYGVRRLTPVECERLQAFPDGWTEPALSDSARYKALGNAVTVNTVGWILARIKALM